MGFEDGSGEGVGVVLVSEATSITTALDFYPGLSNISGAWAQLISEPAASQPSFLAVDWTTSTVTVTPYDINGTSCKFDGMMHVYAKGNY